MRAADRAASLLVELNAAAFRALAKIGKLEVVKTETFPIEKVDVFLTRSAEPCAGWPNWVRFVGSIHFFARERREGVRLLG